MNLRKHARKMWIIVALEAASTLGEEELFIIQFLFRLLRVVVLLSLWRVILTDHDTAGMTLSTILTYTLIQEVYAEQLLPRTNIEWALHDGGIAMRFLQPLDLVSQFMAHMVGGWVFGLVFFSLPLLLVAPWLGVNPSPVSVLAGALFLVSVLCTMAIGVAFDFIFAALLTHFEGSAYMVGRVRVAISLVLSGALVPLALLPWNLGAILQWLPFASLASAPLRIYTGTGDPRLLLALQVAWAAVLWVLARRLWQHYREQLVSYGG
jgi:ABC-2 type transport system permease protein